VAGAALGAVGHELPLSARAAVGTAVAAGGVALAARGLAGRGVPLQCDRETPRRWVDAGPLTWAVKNGSTLGLGCTTRIGFPLWYAIGVAAFLGGSILGGALIYATYGLTRGGGAAVVIWMGRYRPIDKINVALCDAYFVASRVTNLWLMFVAGAAIVAVGP
jgi:hypothetical protein